MTVPNTQLRGAFWFLRVSLPNGKRHRIKLGPATLSEDQLRALAFAVKTEFDRGGYEVAAPVLTMDTWADRWFNARDARGLTSTHDDRQRWAKWCVDLHLLDVAHLDRSDIEGNVRGLDVAVREGRLSWKTARNVWGVVSRMCRDMCRSKDPTIRVRETNPAEGVEPTDDGDSAARVYLYPSEATQLLGCGDIDPQWRALYALAMYTGLRRAELDALRWGDVETTVVRVSRATGDDGKAKTTKTGHSRTVPIEPSLAPLLRVLRGAPSSHVCRAPMWQAPQFRAHLRAAGLDRAALFARGPGQRQITFHDLRATCATWQAVRGDDPLKIQRRMGHTGLATTQRYIREAESLGDVGAPFPAIPQILLLALVQRLDQDHQNPPKAAKMSQILASPAGFEPVTIPETIGTFSTTGPTPDPANTPGDGPRSNTVQGSTDALRKAVFRNLSPALHAVAGIAIRGGK